MIRCKALLPPDKRQCPNPLSIKNTSGYCRYHAPAATQGGVKRPQFSNDRSARWNGGEYISSDGYLMVKGLDGDFCESGRQRYYRKHVQIVEEELGRRLKTTRGGKGEAVHHIDGDKLNNSLSNLILCDNARSHRNLHASLELVAFELVRRGVIGFDRENRRYFLAE